MVWVRAVQTNNVRCLLGIRRISRIPNVRIKELCRVAKGLQEKIFESVLRWLERMENDRIVKNVYVGDCVGSRLVC